MDIVGDKLAENNKNSLESNKIPILSFFTGGGFLDLGFEQAGFEVVWTNEINPVFRYMYEYGMTAWRLSTLSTTKPALVSERRSIADVTSNEIIERAFPGGIPDFFGIIGGPPCPDFSVCGKNQGGAGNKGVLSRIFINKICEINPDFFVIENVPGLLRTKKHQDFLIELVCQLKLNNYIVDMQILNALELGVPQNRERLIIVGLNQNKADSCIKRTPLEGENGWFPWPAYPKYRNAKVRFNWPNIVPMGKKPEKPEGIPEELMVNSVLNEDDPPSKQPNGLEGFKPHSKKFEIKCEGDTRGKSFKRLHRYRYSPTACYGHNEVHLHPWENRRLTVREAMRIQGIPDTYILPEETTLKAKFAIIGNGVPVPLAWEVAKSLDELLRNSTI